MKIRIPVLVFLCLFTAVGAFAEKMPIAIMDLEAVDVPKNTARAVSDIMRTEMFNTGLFRVFERGEMEKILKEQQFGQSGLSDVDYAIKVGKLLSAKKICVGTVSKLGTSYIVNARIIDVERGEMEFAERGKSDTETDLDNAVVIFARKIAARINAQTAGTAVQTEVQQEKPVKTVKKKPERAVEPEQVAPREHAAPGGHKLLAPAIIIMGVGAVSGGLSFLFNANAKKDYKTYKESGEVSKLSDLWGKVNSDMYLRDISMYGGIGLGAIGLTLLIIDLASGSGSRTASLDAPALNLAYNGSGYDLSYTKTW